ncbi:hypothetical protein HDV05_003292 [Chytridiales sp. JEL 0842]|nr:hypothetical protein HDV05_003292 [Chytridiales sp. JEL 0842]
MCSCTAVIRKFDHKLATVQDQVTSVRSIRIMLWAKASATVAGLILARTIYTYLKAYARAKALKRMNPTLTIHVLPVLPHQSLLAMLGLLPKWVFRGFHKEWHVERRYEPYSKASSHTIALVSADRTAVYCADPDLCRDVMVNRWTELTKPVHNYALINIYGRNVVSTEGKEWRRHRKISAPSFSEKNMYLVHEETIKSMETMFKAWETEAGKNGVDLDMNGEFVVNVTRDMLHMALSVISAAAFGIRLEWESENSSKKVAPQGHSMSFQDALVTVMYRLGPLLITPRFMFKLPIKYLRDTYAAYEDLNKYLKEFIANSTNSSSDSNTLLSLLVNAANEEEGQSLTQEELIGNAFIFMVAGHETTAGVLNYTLGHLAINQDIQEKLYVEVVRVTGTKDLPSYQDYNEFPYIHAIMHESLRLNGPVPLVAKWTGDQERILGPFIIPPKTNVNISTNGLHYNPQVWGPDVNEYRPERFLSDPTSVSKSNWNKNAFAPFSEGPRACLGKKFSQVEFCCALAMLSQRYTWRVQPGTKVEGMLESHSVLTTKTKRDVKLLFKRR